MRFTCADGACALGTTSSIAQFDVLGGEEAIITSVNECIVGDTESDEQIFRIIKQSVHRLVDYGMTCFAL